VDLRARATFLAALRAAAILACAFALSVLPNARAASPPAALPSAVDLNIDAGHQRANGVPIVLFFNRDGCPYCERALREYLGPMQGDPAYRAKAMFRQIEIDRRLPLVDFDGSRTTHRQFAIAHRIKLTPTLHFVDSRGNDLVPPIVGLPTLDFFQSYLDTAIDDSRKKLAEASR
jgi:thioredoxin-related protein